MGGFGKDQQIELKEVCDELNKKKIKFLLSNSNTEFIRNLYNDYNIEIVNANRSINSVASKRGEVEEVLVRNYDI
jgi:DNA adenine methylase